ncbi:hypothetical protein JY231_03530 [Lactobacillus helveticus]|nr:hypothetical protein [Lactobacillus helveticus]
MLKIRKKSLKVLVTCLAIFGIIDGGLYILFDFECIDALLKLLGVKSVISITLRWIIGVLAIAANIFIGKYDEDQRKY